MARAPDPAVGAQLSGFDAGAQPPHQRVVQSLRAGAGVGVRVDHGLVGVGQVMARSHRRLEDFEVGPRFGGDPGRESTHPVGALRSQRGRAPVHPIPLVEPSVRVESVGDATPDGGDERGVLGTGVAYQGAFHPVLLIGHRDRQHVQRPADLADVVLTDRAVGDRLGQRR
jgi:hypothetical protein